MALMACALLCSGAVAAFIQSPIPASSRDNYLLDRDGDGRLDGISIKFLGAVDQDYLEQMVDSLTLDWVDSTNEVTHVNVPRSRFRLDSSSARKVFVDLSEFQRGWYPMTALHSEMHPAGSIGKVGLYLSEGTVFNVVVKDQMAPVILETNLRSYRGRSADTLSLKFSESMTVPSGCESFLDFKSAQDSVVRVLPMTAALWNVNATEALVILDASLDLEERLAPRDSLRLLHKCIGDSLKNLVPDSSRFVAVSGFFPMEVRSSAMVVDNQRMQDDTPIFQLMFEDADAEVPNDNAWGFSMEAMGDEFLNAVRNSLGKPNKAPLDLSKLKIHYNVRIYTNLGTFVVGTSADVKGDDSRFGGNAKRLFLKWNMMDGLRRRVAVGAYIANIVVHVTYDGETVFRNDIHNGPTTQIFGVKRR